MAHTIGPVFGPSKSYNAEAAIFNGAAVVAGATPSGVLQASAAGVRCIGIATLPVNYGPSAVAGNPVAVTRQGDAFAIAGGPVLHGQYLKVNAAGQLVPVTGTAGGGEEVLGRAESDAIAPGDEIVVFVSPFVL